jgi:hypothetical protein
VKKDWKYIAYLSAAIAFYLVVKLLSPAELDWTITYHPDDKNPFGAYALNDFMPSLFPGKEINKSNYTFYEWIDTLQRPANFLSISTTFNPGKEDTDALLKNIERGGTAFISAQYFTGHFADTLFLFTSDYFFEQADYMFNRNDTSQLVFKNPALQTGRLYRFPRKNIHNYFAEFDSTGTVVTVNDLELPVTIKINHGQGSLYLNSTPLTLTNIYLLDMDNHGFAETSLSHLPNRLTYWTEFYHLGRLEARTPLRFILSNEPLRWAYYVTITGLLLFMLFEVKRKQRIIPIVKPLANTSLEFVQTIGNLYYQSSDHKNIAEKRIQFLIEQLQSKHGINAHAVDEAIIQTVVRKTENSEEVVVALFGAIQQVQGKTQISEEELKALNAKIDSFRY